MFGYYALIIGDLEAIEAGRVAPLIKSNYRDGVLLQKS
jgi:hypothetical protein